MMGRVAPGEYASASLTLYNPTAQSLSVQRIETSCECIGVGPVPVDIRPSESRDLVVKFDGSREPEFLGALGVQLIGKDSGNRILFRTQIELEVRPVIPRTKMQGSRRISDPGEGTP